MISAAKDAREPRKGWAVARDSQDAGRASSHRAFALVARASHRAVPERRLFDQRWSFFNQPLISVTLRAVETSIELRYAGVVIGKATVSGPIDESGENSVFVPVPDPLPVGTKVGLKVDDRTLDGRVIAVAESTESSKCGMKIRIGGASSAKSSGTSSNVAAPSAPAAPAPAAHSGPAAGAPAAPAPAMESAPIDGAVSAESGTDVSAAHGDGSSDGVPSGDEGAGGQSGPQGGGGGGRRRRRRR